MKVCEYCKKEHTGKYASGRFCNSFCSRGFSTSKNKKSIARKISAKLKKPPNKKICIECNLEFDAPRPKAVCCSVKCANKITAKKQTGKNKKSGKNRKLGSGGLRSGGGRSKQIEYFSWLGERMMLNIEEIEVAKILDSLKLNWKRNNKGFPYIDKKNNNRKYYPDFYINDFILYLEYKGWIIDSMRHKMNSAVKEAKINHLIVVGSERYLRDGLIINKLKSRLNEMKLKK